MQKRILFSLFFLIVSLNFFAQTYTLSGKMTNTKNNALPFASVLVKGTTIGTNSNINGLYSIKLKPGTYEIIFQYIGYKKRNEDSYFKC